jgi:hypothetical protein
MPVVLERGSTILVYGSDGSEAKAILVDSEGHLKTKLVGAAYNGDTVDVPVTTEGHIETAIHSPLTPFGAVHTESMTPVFQIDGVYGIPTDQTRVTNSGSGAVTASNNLLQCSTGTTIYSYATLQSRKRIRYRPGLGSYARFSAMFTTPVASSIQVAGLGSAESGLYYGYNGTSFGILWSTGGKREIRTLTVSTASTSTSNYNVTLNGTAYNVTATNNNSTLRTAYEISQGSFGAWQAMAVGSTVVFLSGDSGAKSGSYSLAQSGAGTPAAGSFAQTLAGQANTDTWVPQSSWNVDPLDGTGKSGVTLDPTKLNVYAIAQQYLGTGPAKFYVKIAPTGNNPTWQLVHWMSFPNSRTAVNLTQPSAPFTMASYSAGSTTDLTVSTASFAGFVEGESVPTGARFTFTDTSTAVSTGAYYSLFTVRNNLTYGGRANQGVVRLFSVGAAHDDATPCTLYLLRNATLVGTPNFTNWSTTSCCGYDTAATTATISDNNQIIYSLPIGEGGSETNNFEDIVEIQPGESITVAAIAVTGTATYFIVSLNVREDK